MVFILTAGESLMALKMRPQSLPQFPVHSSLITLPTDTGALGLSDSKITYKYKYFWG